MASVSAPPVLSCQVQHAGPLAHLSAGAPLAVPLMTLSARISPGGLLVGTGPLILLAAAAQQRRRTGDLAAGLCPRDACLLHRFALLAAAGAGATWGVLIPGTAGRAAAIRFALIGARGRSSAAAAVAARRIGLAGRGWRWRRGCRRRRQDPFADLFGRAVRAVAEHPFTVCAATFGNAQFGGVGGAETQQQQQSDQSACIHGGRFPVVAG